MKYLLTLLAAIALGACGDQTPPPAAKKAEVVTPAPVAAKAPEAPKPEPKAEEPKPDPNKELAARVKRALQDDNRLQAQQIDVTASSGTVTLWGTAANASDRNRAAAAAAKVAGVKTVENKLSIVTGS
jgi:hyperosmotically inducible protein